MKRAMSIYAIFGFLCQPLAPYFSRFFCLIKSLPSSPKQECIVLKNIGRNKKINKAKFVLGET
jgi:hypothetical protein